MIRMDCVNLFRGTTIPAAETTRLGVASWTPCLEVATVYAAVPGDSLRGRKPSFLPTSRVHSVRWHPRHPMDFGAQNAMSISDLLERLSFGSVGGIDASEARKIFNYLHRRAVGATKAGAFLYVWYDEDGEIMDESELFGGAWMLSGLSLFTEARDRFDLSDSPSEVLDELSDLYVDTFALADVPAVQRAAIAQGYDALVYEDIMGAAEHAMPELLGVRPKDVPCLAENTDIQSKRVWTHATVRLLPGAIVSPLGTMTPDKALLKMPQR